MLWGDVHRLCVLETGHCPPFFCLVFVIKWTPQCYRCQFSLCVCEREFPDCSVQSAFVSYPVSTVAFPIASPRGQQRKM